MVWAELQFSKKKVNKAGETLVDPTATIDQLDDAIEIINNWRSCHYYPLHMFYLSLKTRARKFDSKRLVARRIKRLPAIKLKLEINESMNLSQMQDIGGCRAIVNDITAVNALVKSYEEDIRFPHKIDHKDDYISSPKNSGYRSVHLIFRYHNEGKFKHYNDQKIEMQIRTQLQHAWATTVEIVGLITKQALKSNIGDDSWKRFFSLMGSVIAEKERMPLVPNTPIDKKFLLNELREHSIKLDVKNRLSAYGRVLSLTNVGAIREAEYLILNLDVNTQKIEIFTFKKNEMKEADKQYAAIEKKNLNRQGYDAVLVSVGSLAKTKKAYPNYFLDSNMFLNVLDGFLIGK